MMQANLLVGPIPSYSHNRSSGSAGCRHRWRPAASSSSSPPPWMGIDCKQNHYDVLGLKRSATSSDIKRAYRLLARKHHPDVSKDSQSSEVFKSIRHAYETLSNESSRTHYDRALNSEEDPHRQYGGRWKYRDEFDDEYRVYRWSELRQRMRNQRHWERYEVSDDESPFHSGEEDEEDEERGSFSGVLLSAFLSLFLMQTVGCLLSLTFTSFMALIDRKLDAGYKIGYIIAWVLGGRGGILLTMCLSFASWVCGKTRSRVVVLVVAAMWFSSNLARYAPMPQGALLTLLYMSIKLQVDLK